MGTPAPHHVDVSAHARWAEAIATSIGRDLRFDRRGQELDDLRQVALLLLVDRAAAFDPARVPAGGDPGGAFRGWAHPTIKQGVVREARRLRNGGTYHTRRENEHAGPVTAVAASTLGSGADGDDPFDPADHRGPVALEVDDGAGEGFWRAARAILGAADAEVVELVVRGGFTPEQVGWMCRLTPAQVGKVVAAATATLAARAGELAEHASEYAPPEPPPPTPEVMPAAAGPVPVLEFTRRAVESRPVQPAAPVRRETPDPIHILDRSAPVSSNPKTAAEPATGTALVELLAAVDPADAAAAIEAELLRLERRAAVLTAVRDALVGADGRGLAG